MGGGYWMPDGSNNWQATSPGYFAQILQRRDEEQRGRLKPLIRLLKAWNIANGGPLSSFHLEVMVTRIARGKEIPAWPTAVASTLHELTRWIDTVVPDPGQGFVLLYRYRRLDRYLKSDERKRIKEMLRTAAKQGDEAEKYRTTSDVEQAFERWSAAYRGMFPAYG